MWWFYQCYWPAQVQEIKLVKWYTQTISSGHTIKAETDVKLVSRQ